MSLLSRLRSAFFALVLFPACAWAADKPYVNDDLASSATRLEQKLAEDSADLRAHTPLAELRKQAAAAGQKGDIAKTLPILGAIVAAAPQSAPDWISFARASLAASMNKGDDAEQLKDQAQAAAFAAYRHARAKTEEATALALTGEIFAARELWRDALNAYRASLDAGAIPAVQKTYAELREKYGFRVLDYKVDNELLSPRICFQFSEDLARGQSDFSPFVSLDGRSDAAISSEERQVCVEGLKHGEHYSIVLRQGLPSAVGENLLRTQDYDIYVRDRSPQARFTGRNYVLPRVGPEGVPVVSVNTSKVEGRNLPHRRPKPAADHPLRGFPRPAFRLSPEAIRRQRRPEDLVGEPRRQIRTQQGRRHRFPGAGGARRAAARRLCDERRSRRRSRRQWRRGLRRPRDAMVRRVRSRPHGVERQRRRHGAGSLAGDGRNRRPELTCG